MKVLILSINDSLGGAELYLKNVASNYIEAELEIAFITSNASNSWDDLKGNTNKTYYSKKNKLFGVFNLIIHAIFNKIQYDYIFTSHIHTNGLIGALRALGLIKTNYFICRESTSIFLRYQGISLWAYKMIYKIGYRKIDLIICQTNLMKDQLISNFKRIDEKTNVVVIPNPINLKRIAFQSKELPKYNFDYIAAAGRLINAKGFDILIESLAKLKQTNKELKLIILGEGELLDELKVLSFSLRLEKDVIFEGHVPNVLPYFKNATACVVSSRIEGFPNVLLQMMSQNNTVVSTKCAGGIDEIPGIISCETNSIESLQNSIIQAINMKHNEANRILFDTYLENRNIDKFLDKVMAELD